MLEDLVQAFVSQSTPFIIFLAVLSFIYAALGKSKMFHFEKAARLVLSFALAYFASSLVNWVQIVTVTAAAVTLGLTGFLLYHVAIQRGKTKHESLETIETENDQSITESLRRRIR